MSSSWVFLLSALGVYLVIGVAVFIRQAVRGHLVKRVWWSWSYWSLFQISLWPLSLFVASVVR